MRAALQEDRAATELVGVDVGESADDVGHEGGVVTEADGFEEHGSVEHDDVDAGELLERGREGMRMTIVSRGAPRSWPPARYGHPRILQLLQDVRPGVLHALGLLVGHHQVVILGLDVVGAEDLAEHGIVFLVVAALDEGVGGYRTG
ncbi:hypothetical protein C4D60_Mb11t12760 [Musa balbisiana]|uniref:Uncharacterized protein n=1 Tax=Musa balbisiana TaxID=52838 RepID=A0A4S8J3N8_MUSBA|nr:hypothetical protein C4D60_Mb11t12760 [Musa balbisiana]